MIELVWPSVCAGCEARGEGRLCPRCRPGAVHRVPLVIEGVQGVLTCGGYDGGIGRALRVAKYGPDRRLMIALADDFGAMLGPVVARGGAALVVPAPMPWTRRLARGFAPATILAEALGRAAGVPVEHALWARPGAKQAGKNVAGRRNNLHGRIRSVREIQERVVLLVDDVVTTGATAAACTRELLGAGARDVWVCALCAPRVTAVRKL